MLDLYNRVQQSFMLRPKLRRNGCHGRNPEIFNQLAHTFYVDYTLKCYFGSTELNEIQCELHLFLFASFMWLPENCKLHVACMTFLLTIVS